MSRILVDIFSSLSKEIYRHGLSDAKSYIATRQKKNVIRETSFLSHESPCLSLNIFKLLNKREVRSDNLGKTVVVFRHIFRETLGLLVRLVGTTKV